jgi:hypothetical protein
MPVFIELGAVNQYILKVLFGWSPLHKHIVIQGFWQNA